MQGLIRQKISGAERIRNTALLSQRSQSQLDPRLYFFMSPEAAIKSLEYLKNVLLKKPIKLNK